MRACRHSRSGHHLSSSCIRGVVTLVEATLVAPMMVAPMMVAPLGMVAIGIGDSKEKD